MTPLTLEASSTFEEQAYLAFSRVEAELCRVIHGKPEAVRLALCCLAATGHLLIEDVPGVGKTTLARSLAHAIGGVFRRIQFTSDLLPSDILGVSIFHQESGKFNFHPGPIFANVVLADEINRTTPRTQSSLLQAMSEGRVSIDNETYSIAAPFLVVATQNPIEHFGTYPLPESQMDRFLLRIHMGYPSTADEKQMILASVGGYVDPAESIRPVISLNDVELMQQATSRVKVEDSLLDYAQQVVAETRSSTLVTLGISPRGLQAWYRAAKAHAFAHGRDYALPDDFKELALAVLGHRLILHGGNDSSVRGREEAERILEDILDRVPAPT